MRGAEDEHPARADRHFLAGLRIAADPLALLPHRETAEGRNLDHLAAFERVGNLGNHRLDEFGRLVARQADLLIDRLGELSAGNRMTGHDALPLLSERLARPENSVKFQSVARDFPGRRRLPPGDARAPGQPATQRFHQHEMAGPDAAVRHRLVESERDRGGRCIGVALDRDHGLVPRQAELAADRIDDPGIRLVRHQPIDIARQQTVGRQRLVDDLAEMLHRLPVEEGPPST